MKLLNQSYIQRIVTFVLVISLVMSAFIINGNYVHAESQDAYIKMGTSNLRVRDNANGNVLKDDSGNTIYLNGGDVIVVTDVTNSAWYKIQFSYGNDVLTGYVSSDYVVFGVKEEGTVIDEDDNNPGVVEGTIYPVSDDAAFEKNLTAEKFPESYKAYLRDLHEQHPYWEFKAVHTGIDWNTLIEKEKNKSGQIKNLINCTASAPHYNWRATVVGYDYKTDTWSPYDGTNWYAASQGLVTYYLDPRVYLYESYVFVFESQSYQEGVQNIKGIEAILNGTFMYNKVPTGESQKYSEIIMEAGKKYGVSPYMLAARMKQEMGATGGVAAKGTHATYPGIYNYFNIGANDSASGNAVTNGIKWAATSGSYGRPWNTVKKAIYGGAQYLGEAYINKGQNTLYTQKFNVTNKSSLFSHQYMSNIQAPSTESTSSYKAYKSNGILDSSMVFLIPVYTNMPETTSVKPADSGNPNNYLKTLKIDGYSLTPSFAVSTETEYSLIVPANVSSINISGTTVNSYAKISGTGKINLNEGTNQIVISVTAQNGNVRAYNLTVVRGSASGNISTPPVETPPVQGNGSILVGDLNGDGEVTARDIVKVQRLIVGIDAITQDALSRGDVNGDGDITARDIVKIQRIIVGLDTPQYR